MVAGTPKPIVDKLYAAAMQALQQPGVRDQFAKLNITVVADTPEVAARKLVEDARFYADIAKRIGL